MRCGLTGTSHSTQNPPYGYYLFYLYANLYSLNHMRQARGLRSGCPALLCARVISRALRGS